MKVLKYILYAVLTLVAIYFLVGLFVNKNYTVERSVTINKPKQEVFEFLKYLKNQNQFSTWAKKDPNMKRDFKGTDAMPGATASWDGNSDVGKGEQEIKGIVDGEKIDYELRFEKPMKDVAQATITTVADGENSTKVTWSFHGENAYPKTTMNLFMGWILGGELQKGLANLKELLEK
jgi:uncharacterized protein YndB with AHSA1/START domain